MATVMEERPATEPAAPQPVPQRSAVPLSRWRLASRLARREVRRRPGRTLLVTLLVAVPVFGMTVASILAHTTSDPWAEDFVQSNGRADLVVQTYGASGMAFPETPPLDDAALASALPAGSRWEQYGRVYGPVSDGSETVNVEVTDLDVDSPLLRGVLALREGEAPMGPQQIALDRSTADRFGVDVGDELTLREPAGTWTVSGIVRREAQWGQRLVVFGQFDWQRVDSGSRGTVTYVDLPAATAPAATAALVDRLSRFGYAEARDVPPEFVDPSGDVGADAMVWGWVAGVLALCVVGIIIAAAFATSARRQLVTLGQLSANGADQRLLRRTMSMQGSWSGLIGSLAGVGVGLLALVLGRGQVERIVQKGVGTYEISLRDLTVIVVTGAVAATVAALVPARSIARVPVMAALAGRRPLGIVPRRMVPIGLGLFGAGLFLLLLAATASTDGSDVNLFGGVAVLGGLGVLFGMCCLTPIVVDVVGRLGARASGSWRLSARSLARTRTRTAGVVTAIAAAGALALGGATAFASTAVDQVTNFDDGIPDDTVILGAARWSDDAMAIDPTVTVQVYDPPPYRPAPIPAPILDRVRTVVGGSEFVRRVAVWDPAPFQVDENGGRIDGSTADTSGVFIVADPELLDLIGLSDGDRDRLADAGAMTLVGGWSEEGIAVASGNVAPIVIERSGEPTAQVDLVTPQDPIESPAGVWTALVTPQRAAALGLDIVDDGYYLRGDDALTDGQLQELWDIQQDGWNSPIFDTDTVENGEVQTTIAPTLSEADVPETLVNTAIVVAALLFTLAVVAVGLALSAAESRDERDVLVAIGAKPSTMRRVAGQKAALMALAGTVLAVPTGLLPVGAVVPAVRQYDGQYPLDMPWAMIGALVLGVPVLAGLVTWLGSSIAQRLRPVRMSGLALD